jgi:hypothetical protein
MEQVHTTHRTPYFTTCELVEFMEQVHTIHRTPHTLHFTPYITHLTLYTLHHTPHTAIGHATSAGRDCAHRGVTIEE